MVNFLLTRRGRPREARADPAQGELFQRQRSPQVAVGEASGWEWSGIAEMVHLRVDLSKTLTRKVYIVKPLKATLRWTLSLDSLVICVFLDHIVGKANIASTTSSQAASLSA